MILSNTICLSSSYSPSFSASPNTKLTDELYLVGKAASSSRKKVGEIRKGGEQRGRGGGCHCRCHYTATGQWRPWPRLDSARSRCRPPLMPPGARRAQQQQRQTEGWTQSKSSPLHFGIFARPSVRPTVCGRGR